MGRKGKEINGHQTQKREMREGKQKWRKTKEKTRRLQRNRTERKRDRWKGDDE